MNADNVAFNVAFLRHRERSLSTSVANLQHNFQRFADDASDHPEWQGFADRIESCLREVSEIRAAIGDMADELDS